MSSVDIRPATVKAGASNFRPFRMPAYNPQATQHLFQAKRMGQKKMGGSFSSKEIPLSLAVGAGSAGVIVMGLQLPSPGWKGFLIGAGLLGLGFSVYNLFSGPEAPPSGEQSSSNAAPTPTKSDFDQITGSFTKPRMYEQVDQPGPDWFMTANYFDIYPQFAVTNPTNTPVTLTLRLTQQETSTRMLYPNSKDSKTYSKVVTVPAKTTVNVEFDIDTLNYTGSLSERLIMEKIRSGDPADAAVKLSEVTFFV